MPVAYDLPKLACKGGQNIISGHFDTVNDSVDQYFVLWHLHFIAEIANQIVI